MQRPKPEDDLAETQILDDPRGQSPSIDPEKTVVMDKDHFRRSPPDQATRPKGKPQ